MSKQSEAKKKQNYVDKEIPQTCVNCGNMIFDMVAPKWMRQTNERIGRGEGRSYEVLFDLNKQAIPSNLRCGIGGFAVKKMGTCNLFVGKVVSE